MLGVGDQTIANWQKDGTLNALKGHRLLNNGQKHEVFLYNPREIAKVPVRRVNGRLPGDIAARAFEMFDRGDAPRAVVISTREEPEKVEELYSKWLDMGGADVVITIDAKMELQRLVGPFETVAALIVAVRERVGAP